jgi:hypothetical protein
MQNPLGVRVGYRFEKKAVLAPNKFLSLCEMIILTPQRAFGKTPAIVFIGRKVFDVIDTIGDSVRPFMRGVITDKVCATGGDGLSPGFGILDELAFFIGVDFIANEAGNHIISPHDVRMIIEGGRDGCFALSRSIYFLKSFL